MNNVILVENAPILYPAEVTRYYEIIVPLADDDNFNEPAGFVKHNGKMTEFTRGEIVVIPPRTPRTVCLKDKKSLRLLLDGALLPFGEVTAVCELPDYDIRNAAEQALRFYQSSFKRRGAVLAALGSLIVSLLTLIKGEHERLSPTTVKITADIKAHVSDASFSLEDYLHNLPLSYDYARKIFKKDTGLTPHEYLKNARMERAAQLLASGQTNRYSFYTVSQIADLCGFSDSMYFSKTFKKYYGVAPSDYGKK